MFVAAPFDCTFAVSVDKQGIADDWQRGRAGDAVDVSHQAPIALQVRCQAAHDKDEAQQQQHASFRHTLDKLLPGPAVGPCSDAGGKQHRITVSHDVVPAT